MPDYSEWFYGDWLRLLRVLIVGLLAYAGLVTVLRISGKRTLAKMNAFDLVVTVALGSILGSTVVSRDVALLEGLTAFLILIAAQWMVAWTCARSPAVSNLVKSAPTMLLWKGDLLREVIRRERMTEEEVFCAIREAGYGDISKVGAVVLETTGDISVIGSVAEEASCDALRNVTDNAGDK